MYKYHMIQSFSKLGASLFWFSNIAFINRKRMELPGHRWFLGFYANFRKVSFLGNIMKLN